ncbi:PREDICTED: longitudinals lacking protein, isoforms H/M/V-like isoform X2 [Papilio polytes]|uniref:longitudinals lacking protein, isoforms H/M/V-like isoform X2 n=1 Tax=Papilio polytes TaxID=76194 RepID=UPI0006766350|nr:PREDICTED: longitudinals lacking protein, isoforms H/M/V-like isoform X2 [Papilio polytes]
MVSQQYCLRWKHHHSNVQNMFAQLLEKERFCDVTLYCSPSFATQVSNKDTVEPENIRGVSLRAHRVVLAACSELLAALLGAHEAHGEPVLVIDGAEPRHLRALLDYMYTGEMSVHHSQLASLLKTAEELRIKGLTHLRVNNNGEPPDCETGVITTTTVTQDTDKQTEKTSVERRTPESRPERPIESRPERPTESRPERPTDTRTETADRFQSKRDTETSVTESNKESKPTEKFNINGGPPPLIKLPLIEKTSPLKRETSDTESPSPKRKRLTSGTENTDEEALTPKTEQEWQHGNLDITAERVVSWGAGESGEWSREGSDDDWADAPADIGSFLSTSLRVDGDNSADDSEDSTVHTGCSSAATAATAGPAGPAANPNPTGKSKQIDPRFTDVIKLNDYLQHGRRPQFWEESYVKKVMEAVRLKELEMKHAAELLGVSYGTLYGRYRDVYGCINRPYRVCSSRELWHAGPADVLERLQRGEVTRDAAALALGVAPANLAAYVLDLAADKEFEPIPIEMDSTVKMRTRTVSAAHKPRKSPHTDKSKKLLGNMTDEDSGPGVTSPHDKCQYAAQPATSGKWPSIRVASIESLREGSASGAGAAPSPSALMRTRPDLTIVAARRREDDTS